MSKTQTEKVDYDNDPFYAGEKPQESINIPEGVRIQMGELRDFFQMIEEDSKAATQKFWGKTSTKDEEELDIHSMTFLRQT
jgi:hypothetical protein